MKGKYKYRILEQNGGAFIIERKLNSFFAEWLWFHIKRSKEEAIEYIYAAIKDEIDEEKRKQTKRIYNIEVEFHQSEDGKEGYEFREIEK